MLLFLLNPYLIVAVEPWMQWIPIKKIIRLVLSWRRPACQTLSKVLDIPSATARVAQGLLKVLAILEIKTVRNHKLSNRKTTFSQMINKHIIYKFFKDFANHKKKSKRVVVFSCKPFPNIFKYKNPQSDPPTIWKASPSDTYWKVQLVCVKVQALVF